MAPPQDEFDLDVRLTTVVGATPDRARTTTNGEVTHEYSCGRQCDKTSVYCP